MVDLVTKNQSSFTAKSLVVEKLDTSSDQETDISNKYKHIDTARYSC